MSDKTEAPTLEEFDVEAIYGEQVAPLLAQAFEICKANHIPILFTATVKREKVDGTMRFTNAICIGSIPERTPDELHIARLLVTNGKEAAIRYLVGSIFDSAMNGEDQGEDEKEFIPWGGGECPVPLGTLVDVKHRDGDCYTRQKAGFPEQDDGEVGYAEDWSHSNCPGDIIGYRISEQ